MGPFTGTGFGGYQAASDTITEDFVLAHNTYIQMAAEWGLVLTGIFLLAVIWLLKNTGVEPKNGGLDGGCQVAVMVFLVGSLGISLNNARILWVLLGALFALSRTRDAGLGETGE